MKKPLLIAVAVAAGLFLTNPNRGDFENYLEKRFEKDANFESTAGEIFGNLLTGGLATLLAENCDRQDFGLFSIYKLDDDDRYLGLLGTFFEL